MIDFKWKHYLEKATKFANMKRCKIFSKTRKSLPVVCSFQSKGTENYNKCTYICYLCFGDEPLIFFSSIINNSIFSILLKIKTWEKYLILKNVSLSTMHFSSMKGTEHSFLNRPLTLFMEQTMFPLSLHHLLCLA